MTFLPIVARELRVASRRAGTFWTRTLVAAAAVAVGAWFFGFGLELMPSQLASEIFNGLSIVGLVYALVAGRRFSADCLSSEKREGTLGLLFLTDLKGYDIVFGKLAATSVSGFFGLLALVPVMGLPMMLGGIGWWDVWRMTAVLISTFWFSLAIGIFASVLSREARQAYGLNFLLLLFIVAGPPTVAGIIALTAAPPSPLMNLIVPLLFPCPVFTAWNALGINYSVHRSEFFISLATLHIIAALLILLTSVTVPHCWRDRPGGRRLFTWRQWWRQFAYGSGQVRSRFRKRLLDVNAFFWLASRIRVKPAMVWGFLIFMLGWWLYVSLRTGSFFMNESLIATALILNATFKMWVAVETGQRFGEDQSSGAMELLLSTRLTVPEIIRGQVLALRRLFFWPLVTVLIVEVLFTGILMHRFNPERWKMFLIGAAGIIMLGADLVTLMWVAMSSALTSRNPNGAIIKTLSRILILPWGFYGVAAVSASVLESLVGSLDLDWRFYLNVWFWSGVVTDLGFGLAAWTRVRTRFRQLAAAT